jgi:hypothetical protein
LKLELQRDRQIEKGTTGRLFIDGAPCYFTLERPAARFGDAHPCIPPGEYSVVLYHSAHFERLMPLLEDVPGRSGIEIHWGNFISDFKGCIGIGSSRGELPDGSPSIWNSRSAFDALFAALQTAQSEGCTIVVRDPLPATAQEADALAATAKGN